MSTRYSIGIGLNLFDARAVLIKEDGTVVTEIEKKRGAVNANEVIEDLLDLFSSILAKTKKYHDKIECVGIALGGIVNRKKGEVYFPQQNGSSYVYVSLPLKKFLEKKFKFPVTLENDANACAFAEHSQFYQKQKNLVYMFSGVGAGIIVDKELYRGKDGRAGELFLTPTKAMSTSLGEFSFLKQWPADLGMVARAKAYISRGKGTNLVKKISSIGDLSLADIFAQAKKKDKVAREVISEAAFSLGVKIAFIVNLLNPDSVIIGGGLEDAGELFLDDCVAAVKNFSMSEMRRNVTIALSQLGKNATSAGAALIALKEKTLHE